MNKLFLASILAVGLSFPVASQAEVNTFGVSLPAQNTEVSSKVSGGYVATGAGDSLAVQKLSSDSEAKGGYVATSAADSFVVQTLSDSSPQS